MQRIEERGFLCQQTRSLVAFSLALLLVCGGAAVTKASQSLDVSVRCSSTRPQDEVILINSRPVGCTTNTERLASGLQASRYDSNRRSWNVTPWQEVVGDEALGAATVLYIHGNGVTHGEARRRGLDVYRRLARYAEDNRPLRFLIWSWPSAPINGGTLQDFRVKAARTRPVGYQVAWFVEQMPPGMPVGFLGYSYGARIESGAAHLLSGGSLGGLRLTSGGETEPRPAEHVYIAPAFESGWLSPRRYHGLAMTYIDRLLITTNRRDRAMRFYPLLSKQIDERALGFAGPTCLPSGYASRVRLFPVSDSVGRSHDLYDYLSAPGLMRKAWRRLTFVDSPARRLPNTDSPTPAAPTLVATPVAMRTRPGR